MAVLAAALMEEAATDSGPNGPSAPLPPSIAAHRLLSSGRSAALLRPDGEIDWWCAPNYDDRPLLWALLDPGGAASVWERTRLASIEGPPAGPAARSLLRTRDGLVETLDGLVPSGADGVVLVRAVRSADGGPVPLRHRLTVGGFDGDFGQWRGPVTEVGDLRVTVTTGGTQEARGRALTCSLTAGTDWAGVAVSVGNSDAPSLQELVAELEAAEARSGRRRHRVRLPRRHPGRAVDALDVLRACTFAPTGAVVAAPTTSLPEAPGGDRQFDYRYCWLRDAALGVSVAALLGEQDAAKHYLQFVNHVASGRVPHSPLFSISGGPVPEERDVAGVRGWAGSLPIRVGNDATNQAQYDALGMVVEAVSVYLQTGGSLDDQTWATVTAIADDAATAPSGPSSGIWELREERHLVSADIGRWLALDRAIWIARGWRPLAHRRHWKQARQQLRERVLEALTDDGLLPQTYDGPARADASALMVPLFGMLGRKDPRASRLIDATLRELRAGPYLYRYEPDESDGFTGREGAFIPMCWWAVSALAAVGRVEEARDRLDELCRRLPRLLAEEVDPATDEALGNVPLVWSHIELARALYLVDAAERRARWGAAGLWAWRVGRYLRLRLANRDSGLDEEER
ncbi:MAG: hypothetical protein KY454_08340 [Actinobacteria bacterium]|nr:hypothetical protein [Actinomycetota bacterium]MBW3650354.1 hypothetical protein [Actinomycetota bacterium]